MAGRRRKRKTIEYRDVELNIMPFIDIFSMLNTFLLFSAVFLSVGIIEVQVPFLSSAPKKVDETQTRVISATVEVGVDTVKLITSWSLPPRDVTTLEFPLDENGINDLHAAAVQVRSQHEDLNKLTLFSEDEVPFDALTLVLDSLKNREESDPQFQETDPKSGTKYTSVHVFSQVVMGSVIL